MPRRSAPLSAMRRGNTVPNRFMQQNQNHRCSPHSADDSDRISMYSFGLLCVVSPRLGRKRRGWPAGFERHSNRGRVSGLAGQGPDEEGDPESPLRLTCACRVADALLPSARSRRIGRHPPPCAAAARCLPGPQPRDPVRSPGHSAARAGSGRKIPADPSQSWRIRVDHGESESITANLSLELHGASERGLDALSLSWESTERALARCDPLGMQVRAGQAGDCWARCETHG